MASTLTRGPLPPRVYWRRRLLLLTLAILLVVGLGRLLGSSSDAADDAADTADDTARLADAPATSPATSEDATAGPTAGPSRPARRTTAPAEPSGPCADEDVAVTPEVTRAVAGPGNGVTIALGLRSTVAEACTWQVSPRTLTLKITSGSDHIWSSRECPRVVPVADVVLRRAQSTVVEVEWKAKRSDEDCSPQTAWALPGYYHVAAAALGGEPSEVQFELLRPSAPTITVAPEPTPSGQASGQASGRATGGSSAGASGTASPSGAVEPDSTR